VSGKAFYCLETTGISRTAVGARRADEAALTADDARGDTPTRAPNGAFDFGFCTAIDFTTDLDNITGCDDLACAETECDEALKTKTINKAIRTFIAVTIGW
jgi:hypothetical protein